MANTPKHITVQIKTLPESAHALLDGILADVWDECSEQWASDLAYDVAPPENPYRKRLEPHSFGWGFGREGTVNWACSCGLASGTASTEQMARRAHADHIKPGPAYDEIYRHLDTSHNWRADRMLSRAKLMEVHDQDHAQGVVRHDREDWMS